MEDWICLKEASAMTGKSERTLRHYAVEGKIQVKKDGRFWSCNRASLQKISVSLPPTPSVTPSLPKNIPVKFQQKMAEEKRRGRRLAELGVYAELMTFYFKLPSKNTAGPYLRQSIDGIALGYYEFNITMKLEHFRLARSSLVKALVVFQMEKHSGAITQLEDSLIPGVSGLIRRMEKMGERTHAAR